MPRPKKNKKTTIEEFFHNYDTPSLVAILGTLPGNVAWELLSAFLSQRQREFEVAALDLACNDGNSLRAAKASGYACALEEVVNKLIPQFIEQLKGFNGQIESPRPEE